MPRIDRLQDFPNVLIVTGSDVNTNDYKTSLRDALYASDPSTSPVREGTHDFWITFTPTRTGASNWSAEDLLRQPRKMRGIVQISAVPANDDEPTIRAFLNLLFQEVGHHWAVPGDLRFRTGSGELGMPTDIQMTRAINNESPLSGVPLLGRTGSHWSAYMAGDASPLDGLNYVRQGMEDGHAMWRTRDFIGAVIAPEGLDPVTLHSAYNDLDHVVIGTKTAAQAYPSSNGRFRWLEPRLSAPHPYHAGLFVAFDRFDFLIFGFYQDHRMLSAQRTGGVRRFSVSLGTDYHPLADPFNAVALRIVRRGSTYTFQARYDLPKRPQTGAAPKLDDHLDNLAPVDPRLKFDATTFRTLSTLTIDKTPLAIGVVVKKAEHPYLAELAFQNLGVFQPSARPLLLLTNAVPQAFPTGTNFSQLVAGALRTHIPANGPIVRTKDDRLHVLAPFSIVDAMGRLGHLANGFDQTTTSDNAPKVLTKAPKGDFAVATSAKIWRTIFTPWAGGVAERKTVWGIERSLAASDVVVPQNIIDDKQPPPPNNTYRMAFIIVATNRGDIDDTLVALVDRVRSYWDEAFKQALGGLRMSNSSLAQVRVTPASLNFGSVVIGEPSDPQQIRIINDGLGDVTVSVAGSTTGAFRWLPLSNEMIPSGQELQLDVEFHPASTTPAHRVLTLRSDAGTHAVDLRGTGRRASGER